MIPEGVKTDNYYFLADQRKSQRRRGGNVYKGTFQNQMHDLKTLVLMCQKFLRIASHRLGVYLANSCKLAIAGEFALY